jgi:hypothetical protein
VTWNVLYAIAIDFLLEDFLLSYSEIMVKLIGINNVVFILYCIKASYLVFSYLVLIITS